MLGLFERTARFVKRYDDLAGRIGAAAEAYAGEVRSRAFPGAEQVYAPKTENMPRTAGTFSGRS